MRQTLIAYAATLAAVLAIPASTDAGLFGKKEEKPQDYSYTFRMRHYGATGSGCAVNGLTITNRHMVDPRDASDFSPLHKVRFRYEFLGTETEGRGFAKTVSNHADLAIVVLDQDPPSGYAKLGAEPQPGDKITWVEYDWRKQEAFYAPRTRSAEVIRTALGMALVKEGPSGGASGGCAYDKNGDVVGLMTFWRTTEDGKKSGGVEGLWGHWWNDLVGAPTPIVLVPVAGLLDRLLGKETP